MTRLLRALCDSVVGGPAASFVSQSCNRAEQPCVAAASALFQERAAVAPRLLQLIDIREQGRVGSQRRERLEQQCQLAVLAQHLGREFLDARRVA